MCKGPTLTIMHSNEEPNSFFGGMAASSWNSSEKYGFVILKKNAVGYLKLKLKNKSKHKNSNNTIYRVNLHQWKCINK